MKHARLIWTGLAVTAVVGTAAFALASGKAGRSATATTASTSATCSAEMAAQCTPGMAATCGAKGAGATTAGASGDAARGSDAVTADAKGGCPYMSGATAGKAGKAGAACDMSNCPPGMCDQKGMKASAASASGCAMHGADAAAASTGECAMHGKSATAAAAAGCCAPGAKGAKAAGAVSAVPTGGPACSGHGATAMAGGCDACADMVSCESDIVEAGGKVQIVPLKNGLMYVYSAESSARVRAVQAAVARHTERVTAMNAAGDKAKLCGDCKEMRGAAASGKLTREVVNIESGCLTLVTSNDPRVVARLYTMAGVASGPARTAVKS